MGLGLQTLLNARVARNGMPRTIYGYRDGARSFLEPLRKALIPVLHVRSN